MALNTLKLNPHRIYILYGKSLANSVNIHNTSILSKILVWLGKCEVEKKSPSLDDTWEVIRKLLQGCKNHNKHSNQALLSSKNNNTNIKQNKKRKDGNYPKCSPGLHNPLTKHNECNCSFLKGDKNGLGSKKPIQSLVSSTRKHGSQSIILDSGETTSMFNNPEIFTNITQITQKIELANGSIIQASGAGTVQIKLPHCILILSNCLLVKNLSYNLISLGAIMKPNYKILTHDNKPFEFDDHNNSIMLDRTFNSGKFEVTIERNQALATITNHNNILTLHQAAGHPSPEYLCKMFPTLITANLQYPTCNLCKITKLLFKGTFRKPQRKIQFIHTDLFAPINTPSNSGYKYCLRVVDDYSRYVWTMFLKSKSETSFHIQKLIKCIENKCKEKINNLVSNNGSEFRNNQLITFFQDNGITHLTTTPYTPEQNTFTKRGNRITITKARCLLSDSGLDKSFWAEAVRTATYSENITPKKSLTYSTPYYKWFKRLLTYQHLQPFGCFCYYLNNQPQEKSSEKGFQGLFLGYEEGHK
ncbi:hypothetical protein O181_011866 [Austropuccinia psidii MF-1]|uniref:Integrase catalytic domain-containing protein n=1 Tax=Austropuccinia psidii MF-1 TaxID=1389203 RepID=A0A9Q3GLR2_9BASI|nr:hypothetical protein [Austropuccinia psidii MF-1]